MVQPRYEDQSHALSSFQSILTKHGNAQSLLTPRQHQKWQKIQNKNLSSTCSLLIPMKIKGHFHSATAVIYCCFLYYHITNYDVHPPHFDIPLFLERLLEKLCMRQSRKVIWDMINTLFPTLQPTFVALLQHSLTYVHGPSCHSLKFL